MEKVEEDQDAVKSPSTSQGRFPPPSPSPSIPTGLLQAILQTPTARDTPLPPVTLSQVEDALATSEMVQALHKHPPPPMLSPSVTPDASMMASPVSESRPMPQVWYTKNPPPGDLERFPAWVVATLEIRVPVERLQIIIDGNKSDQQKWAARKSILWNAEAGFQLDQTSDPP